MTGADNVECNCILDISQEHDVNYVALQEHFKTVKSKEQWFRVQFKIYSTFVVPAYSQPATDSGRGRGGLAQLSLQSTALAQARVVTKSPRLQAQVLNFSNCKVLWINGYMPCDPQQQTIDETKLLATLGEVESLVLSNAGCEVVWAANMNYDMRRDNHFIRTVASVLERMGLTSVWQDCPIDHTHIYTDGVSTSVIDHFLVSRRLLGEVEDCAEMEKDARSACAACANFSQLC